MSSLLWAGISISPAGQKPHIGPDVNVRITEAIARAAGAPIIVARGDDGSELFRYMVEGTVLTDMFNRLGERVGFGIQAGDDAHALELLDEAHDLLSRKLKIIHAHDEVSIWSWDRAATPAEPPLIHTRPLEELWGV